MDRRSFLKTTGAAAAAATTGVAAGPAESLARPARLDGLTVLRLATDLPADMPGADGFVRRLGDRLAGLSGGRVRLDPVAAGHADPSAAVLAGDAELALTCSLGGSGRSPAHALMAGLPFGLDGARLGTFLAHGGGQLLWDDLAATEGLKPFAAGHGGASRGLWSVEPLSSIAGVRVAAQGGAALVLAALDAEVVDMAGGALGSGLSSGAIAAAVGIDPIADLMLGLPGAARNCALTAGLSSGTQLSAAVALAFWERLSDDDRFLVEAAIEGAALALTRELASHAGLALGTMASRGVAIAPAMHVLGPDAGEAMQAALADLESGAGTEAGRLATAYRGFQELTQGVAMVPVA